MNVCVCLQEGWGYHDGRGWGLDFICDLQPSGSSGQLLLSSRARPPRLLCLDAPWDLWGEVTAAAAAAGDAPST